MKKKNIFDTDIEMVSLDTIGNLEVSYDEMSSPNPELASDVQMVMKETQVFSAEQVEAAIKLNDPELERLQNIEETRVINTEKVNKMSEVLGETKVIDTIAVNDLEEESEAVASEEENTVSYIDDEDSEFESEDPGDEENFEAEAAEAEEEVTYEAEAEDPGEDAYEAVTEEYEEETYEAEAEEEYDDSYEFEADDDMEAEEEYEDSYDFESEEPKKKKRHKERMEEEAAAAASVKAKKEKPSKKEVQKAKAQKEEKIKEEKHKEVKEKESKHHEAKAKPVKEAKAPEANAKAVKKQNAKPHNEKVKAAPIPEVDLTAPIEAVEEVENAVEETIQNAEAPKAKPKKHEGVSQATGNVAVKNAKQKKKKSGFTMGIVEYAGIAIGIALIILLVILGAKLTSNKIKKDNLKQFASIGELYSSIDGIGNEGINAIAEQKQIGSITPEEVPEEVTEEKEEDKEIKEDVAPVSVNFSSIEKDLKIKFINKNTQKLVTGVRFEVEAKGPKGDNFNWVDTDLDGVIYINNLQPGTYEVKVLSVDPYTFPETATKVKVQDTVVYQVINVMDEAKDMSQVNLAQEENQAKDVDQGNNLQDTVKYVDSSATPVGGQDGFVKVNKSDIKDPKTLASAFEWGGFRRVDDVQIEKGASKPVVAIPEGCTIAWDGGNGIAQGNADGSITGLAAGTCTLTATIKNADDSVKEQKSINVTVTEAAPEDVKVTAIAVNGPDTVKAGATVKFEAKITPDNASRKDVIWSSSNDAVATVDGSGNVKGVSAGSATINALSTDGSNVVGSITINVINDKVPVTGITIQGERSVLPGGNIQLTANVTPDNATDKSVTWSSSDPSVASVDGNGRVTGVKAGSVKITAVANDGSNASATVDITVASLKLAVLGTDGNEVSDSLALCVNETYQLTIRVEGYAADGGFNIVSSNNAVTVSSNGLLTAAAVGTADVTVTTNEKDAGGNQITKKISVTVKDDPSKDSTKALMYTKDGVDYQVYYKTSDGKYVEAKWADYYKYDEFYIKGNVEYKYTGWQTIDGNVYYFDENGNKVTGEQIIGGTKYNFASDGSLIKDSGSRGIDVSTYNGTIDWTAVKNSGISFVIIRCGFRGYTKGGLILDSKYQSYIQGATAAGLKVGLYLFSQATNEAEAVEEASLCVNLAQGYKISYPIFIDSEYANGSHTGRADGLDKATRTAVCKAFCETIKSAGYTPGVYASKSWLYNKLDAGQLSGYKIWLAHYTGETDYTGKYDIWQHTDKGKVNGIKGNVDLDISYLGY